MWEQFAQYGLVGLMVCATYAGIAWAVVQILGKKGILREHTRATEAVSECLRELKESSSIHASSCVETHDDVKQLRRAAVLAVDEVEAQCREHGIEVADRCNRIRRELKG